MSNKGSMAVEARPAAAYRRYKGKAGYKVDLTEVEEPVIASVARHYHGKPPEEVLTTGEHEPEHLPKARGGLHAYGRITGKAILFLERPEEWKPASGVKGRQFAQ